MQISKNAVVSMDYTLTNADGRVIDKSEEGEPLTYLHGSGGIVPGLERALEGKSPGDRVTVTVAPEDGYGERDEDLVQTVDRSALKGVGEIEAGMQLRATIGGHPAILTVVGFEGTTSVKLDANHPLAGETLHFDVEVREVRAATREELSHGHVHGPGGHH
jgi:FKBP-type peptidyl-prolyl cis-trans isomerase SlyD